MQLAAAHREELARVARIARECGCRARIGIRVSTRDGWSSQFGTPIVGGAALALFEEALLAVAARDRNAACAIAHRNAVLKGIPKALWLPI